MMPGMIDRMESFLSRATTILLFGVGETMLSSQFTPIASKVRQYAPAGEITLFSNGVSLNDERIDALLNARLNKLYFSIDATDEALFRERRTASFQRFCRNIELTREARAQRGMNSPIMCGSFTATRKNLHELPSVVRFCAKMGFDAVMVIIARIFEADQREDSLFTDAAGIAQAKAAVAEAVELARELGITIECSAFMPEEMPVTCTRPFMCMYVKWDGSVRLCSIGGVHMRDPIYIEVGNLRDATAEELWNSPYAQEVRRGFFETGKMHPICEDCPINEMNINTLSKYGRF